MIKRYATYIKEELTGRDDYGNRYESIFNVGDIVVCLDDCSDGPREYWKLGDIKRISIVDFIWEEFWVGIDSDTEAGWRENHFKLATPREIEALENREKDKEKRRLEIWSKNKELDPYGEEDWTNEGYTSPYPRPSERVFKKGDIVVCLDSGGNDDPPGNSWKKGDLKRIEGVSGIHDYFVNIDYVSIVPNHSPGWLYDHFVLANEKEIERWKIENAESERRREELRLKHLEQDPYGEETWEEKWEGIRWYNKGKLEKEIIDPNEESYLKTKEQNWRIIRKKLNELQERKNRAIEDQNFFLAADLRDEERILLNKLASYESFVFENHRAIFQSDDRVVYIYKGDKHDLAQGYCPEIYGYEGKIDGWMGDYYVVKFDKYLIDVLPPAYRNENRLLCVPSETLALTKAEKERREKSRVITPEDPYGEEIWEGLSDLKDKFKKKHPKFDIGDFVIAAGTQDDIVFNGEIGEIINTTTYYNLFHEWEYGVKFPTKFNEHLHGEILDNLDGKDPKDCSYWIREKLLHRADRDSIRKMEEDKIKKDILRKEMKLKMKDVDPYGEEDWLDESLFDIFNKKKPRRIQVGDICIFKSDEGRTCGIPIEYIGTPCRVTSMDKSNGPKIYCTIKFLADDRFNWHCNDRNLIFQDPVEIEKARKKHADVDPYGEENWIE